MGIIEETFRRLTADSKALDHSDERRDPPELNGATRGSRFPNKKSHLYLSAYGGSNAVDWAFDCVRLIAETASSAEYHFERDGKDLVRYDYEVTDKKEQDVAPEELVNLLDSPNPYVDYVDLIELIIIDLMFAGEFILYLYGADKSATGNPISIYRLNPSMVDVIPGEGSTFISHYEYKVPGKPGAVKLDPKEIIHGKFPNPHDPYRGLSIIAGGPRVFDTELSMVESQAQFFEQGTKLTGVVSTERRVPADVFNLIQRQFKSMYSGARNAYKVAVLEAGLNFTPIQPSAADAQYEQLAKLSRDRITEMFRVPPPLLGNMENANYKMAEAQRVFDTKTMRPLLDRIERIISKGLTQRWGVDFRIDYEYVMPDEDRLNLAGTFAALPGVKVVEVRERAGLKPLGDERDDIVLNMPGENTPMPNAPGQAGRPPAPGNVQAFPQQGQGLPQGAAARAAKAVGATEILDSSRGPAIELVQHQIETQIRTAAAILEVEIANEFKNAKAVPGLAAFKKLKAWRTFRAKVGKILTDAARQALETSVDQHRMIGLNVNNIDFAQIAKELVNRPNGVDSIVGNLKDSAAKIVADGLTKGYEIDQILDGDPAAGYTGLRSLLQDWRSPAEIDRIGLTESVEYYNEGSLVAAENSGYGFVAVTDGIDSDPDCAAANGEIWSIEKARNNRTAHPRCKRHFFPVVVN